MLVKHLRAKYPRVMDNIFKQAHFLSLLDTAHTEQQRALLSTASIGQIEALCEVLLNIIRGVVDVSNSFKRQLQKRAHIVRALLKKSTSRRKKRVLFTKNLQIAKIASKAIQNILESTIDNGLFSSKTHSDTPGKV